MFPRRDIPIVDQHDLERPRLACLERRLMELEVDPERLEGLAQVVREVRLELERFDVAEMIGGIGSRARAREVDEVQNARKLPMSAPELCLCREQIRVEREALF